MTFRSKKICDNCMDGLVTIACGVIEECNGVSATGHEWFTMTPGQKAGSGRQTGEIREYGACPKCGGSGRTKEVHESQTTSTHIDKCSESYPEVIHE